MFASTMFQPYHLESILRPVKLSELNYWSNKLIIAHTIANDQSEQIQFSTNSIKSNAMMMVTVFKNFFRFSSSLLSKTS